MTVSPTRPPTSPPAIPSPRTPQPELPSDAEEPEKNAREQAAPRYPWPEPWRPEDGTRPRTQYWDVATASWRVGSPAPSPRSGD